MLRLEQMLGDFLSSRRHLLARLTRTRRCRCWPSRRWGRWHGGRDRGRSRRRRGGSRRPRRTRCRAIPRLFDHVRLAHYSASACTDDAGQIDSLLRGETLRCRGRSHFGFRWLRSRWRRRCRRRRHWSGSRSGRGRGGTLNRCTGSCCRRLPLRCRSHSAFVDLSQQVVDLHDIAFGPQSLCEYAATHRGNFDGDLVRLQLDQRITR